METLKDLYSNTIEFPACNENDIANAYVDLIQKYGYPDDLLHIERAVDTLTGFVRSHLGSRSGIESPEDILVAMEAGLFVINHNFLSEEDYTDNDLQVVNRLFYMQLMEEYGRNN